MSRGTTAPLPPSNINFPRLLGVAERDPTSRSLLNAPPPPSQWMGLPIHWDEDCLRKRRTCAYARKFQLAFSFSLAGPT